MNRLFFQYKILSIYTQKEPHMKSYIHCSDFLTHIHTRYIFKKIYRNWIPTHDLKHYIDQTNNGQPYEIHYHSIIIN